jgi:glutamyl/glutaminyl-tRNA synthetase
MLTRLAPTPSGFLHLGNAVNFVLAWLVARQAGGQILLRIDDLDADRKRPEYVADIFETLDWLGLDYDLGPTGPDDFEAHWSQRHRLGRYEETLRQLIDRKVVYACALSRKQLAEYGGTYPATGQLQFLPLNTPNVTWRFQTNEPGVTRTLDDDGVTVHDFVVRRRDGLPAYQIASLTDDVDFGVTHLVRGQDLLESTWMQRELAERLRLKDFLGTLAWHHPLLLDAAGQKLSKSAGSGAVGAASLQTMRAAGAGPERVFWAVGTLLHETLGTLGEGQTLADLRGWPGLDKLPFAAILAVK